jgi:hypothetical protein
LVRRLRNLVNVLWDNDEDDADAERVEVDSPEWPGLHATTQLLATSTYLHHTDKDVRLYTVLACIEILTIVRICYSAVNMYVYVYIVSALHGNE